MKIHAILAAFLLPLVPQLATADEKAANDGFTKIFNGVDLTGWKVNTENPSSVSVKDGNLVIDGPRTHVFYNGEVGNHDFKNFEFKCKVKTFKGANSGIYLHTAYQEKGWPDKGYECQVNNTHKDVRKTGSLYAVKDNHDAPWKDGEWFDYHIKVEGKRIVISINGKVITDFTEADDNMGHLAKMPGRKLSSGTIGIQAHDPKSVVHYKDIYLKVTD